jgi:hypothetical protein
MPQDMTDRYNTQNVRNLGVQGLQDYFQQSEPDSQLQLPLTARLYPQDSGPMPDPAATTTVYGP